MTSRLIFITVFALILSTVRATSTQRYSFLFNNEDPTKNPAYNPVFDLGILQLGYTLQVTLTLPNSPASTAISDIVTGDSTTAGLFLIFRDDSDPTNVGVAFPLDSNNNEFTFPVAVSGVRSYTGTYPISFGTKSLTSAKFYLLLDGFAYVKAGDYSFLDYAAL
jgi:hypothetical protein